MNARASHALRACASQAWTALAAPPTFALWRIELGRAMAPEAITLLDGEELRRAARFAFAHLRHRYLAGHVALRSLLGEAAGLEAAELEFARGPHGKPRLVGPTALPSFNYSDSGDLAVLAIAARGEIGVDVETLRAIPDACELAARHFCEREQGWLAAEPPAARDAAFLRVWTRKEACLKAIGSGLSIPAESFDGGLVGSTQPKGAALGHEVSIETPLGRVTVQVMEVDVGSHAVGALAQIVDREGPIQ